MDESYLHIKATKMTSGWEFSEWSWNDLQWLGHDFLRNIISYHDMILQFTSTKSDKCSSHLKKGADKKMLTWNKTYLQSIFSELLIKSSLDRFAPTSAASLQSLCWLYQWASGFPRRPGLASSLLVSGSTVSEFSVGVPKDSASLACMECVGNPGNHQAELLGTVF